MNDNNLPIQIVLSRVQDTVKNTGMNIPKFFCEVNQTIVNRLTNEIEEIEEYFESSDSYKSGIPAVAKIVMRDNAEAKSHKPNRFCAYGLPIIGAQKLGEIYVKVTPKGLTKTKEELRVLPSKDYVANVSAIQDIIPYSNDDLISNDDAEKIRKEISENGESIVKVMVFNFNDDVANIKADNYLNSQINSGEVERKKFFKDWNLYKIRLTDIEQLDNLIKCSFIRKINTTDRFSTIPSSQSNVILEQIKTIENRIVGDSYIGIIDGGISEEIEALKNLVEHREMYVPYDYQDRRHGTFIAGIIQNGDMINDFDSPNNTEYKLVDIIAVPNSDSEYGLTDSLNELDLMDIIIEVMDKYSDKVKIWNLSLNNVHKKCKDDEISEFGAFLDLVQNKYGVQFIVSVGNYEETPVRGWPVAKCYDKDRIVSPADSVRAISVGSVAHKSDNYSIVKEYEPSPFSRRGPGMNFTIKPELVDCGGNLRHDNSYQNIGILSHGEDGKIVEGVGTSYSTPRITKKLATVYDSTINSDLLLAKGLLIHSARFSPIGRLKSAEETKYFGFGLPPNNLSEIINCSQDRVTLIFDQVIHKGSHLEIEEFPYPKSLLRGGKWTGEITMTLIYEPVLDINFGNEYCRANVEVSFGTYRYNLKTEKVEFHGKVPPEVNWDSRYEKSRVENGFKWNPVKSFHHKMRGIRGDDWKLRIDYSSRNEATIESQRIILIMTIEDPNGNDIYTDIISQLQLSGFVFNDLQVRSAVQTRTQNQQ